METKTPPPFMSDQVRDTLALELCGAWLTLDPPDEVRNEDGTFNEALIRAISFRKMRNNLQGTMYGREVLHWLTRLTPEEIDEIVETALPFLWDPEAVAR